MKAFALTALLFSSAAFAENIAGWKETPGLSEAEAVKMTYNAIDNFLTSFDQGERCSVDEVWGYEREKDLKPGRPQRGELFAVRAYASGPDMECTITRNFDCRVVFQKKPGAAKWNVDYADCEPTSPGYED